MIFLSISGTLYLFKDNINHSLYSDILSITSPIQTAKKSYGEQLAAVNSFTDLSVSQIILPLNLNEPTKFSFQGMKRGGNSVYVDPYTAEVTGQINRNDTIMYQVRKFHGELLTGLPGTLLVELTASWFIVLLLTGIYVWWPAKNFALAGFFTIRIGKGRRMFWRDMHSVLGFWLSIFLLLLLAGGMPWTEVFGGSLRWVQDQTDTGYPEYWTDSKGLYSSTVDVVASSKPLVIDEMVDVALQQRLPGQITIGLPEDQQSVFTVTNSSFWLRDQQVIHFDQYTGEVVKSLHWADVGILMEMRQIAMRIHQGEYGFLNWLAALLVGITFTISTVAGLISYLYRKPKGVWGLPDVPLHFTVAPPLIVGIVLLGVVFPLFGASLLIIVLGQWVTDSVKNRAFSELQE